MPTLHFTVWVIVESHRNQDTFFGSGSGHILKYRIYLLISWQFLVQFWHWTFGGRLIRRSCHTAIVDSHHDGYLSATLTVCEPHMAWTISRSLGLRRCVGESTSAGFWMTTHRLVLLLLLLLHSQPCNLIPFQHSDRARPSFPYTSCQLPHKLCAVKWTVGRLLKPW